jgi:hypothetical protein
MFFYVYYSYEPWGRGYIGRRQCKCDPQKDTNYFGSFKDVTFSPNSKVILAVFSTLREAIEAEISLHNFFEVDINPHFANISKQTSSGFSFARSGEEAVLYGKTGSLHPCWGRKRTDEEKRRISKSKKGKRRPDICGEKNPLRNPETVKKISGVNAVLYGKTGENHPCGGTQWWVNGEGKCVRSKQNPGPGWMLGRKWNPKTTG